MSDSEAKIDRWRRCISDCRSEASAMSPEGRQAMQSVIDSYERLIAMVQRQDKQKG